MTEGIKHDGGKVQPALVLETMARALHAVCEVGTFGAQKYSADNWLQVADGLSRYRNAKHRHMLAAAMGEKHDPESGLLHAAHEAWNALAALELELRAGETEKNKDLWCEGEKRMDIIGPNGNDGIHYRALTLPEDVIIPGSAHFIVVYENGQMVAHDLRPTLAQGCWHAAAGNQYIGLGDGSQAGLYERMPGDIWVRVAD